jgi:D-alanyl-D-alanine carboxypeptidase
VLATNPIDGSLTPAAAPDLARRAREALLQFGARPELIVERGLPLFVDATELEVGSVSRSGREHYLVPVAAAQWQSLATAAALAGVELVVISGFRSFDRQFELIAAKCRRGEPIEQVLERLAPPGCSEHHSGRAVDVGTPGCEPLSDDFAQSGAYQWLSAHAGEFGFRLSFPAGNPWGYQYEPWHWCFHG